MIFRLRSLLFVGPFLVLAASASGQSNSFATAYASAQIFADNDLSVLDMGIVTPYNAGSSGNAAYLDGYSSDGFSYINSSGSGYSALPGGSSFGIVDAISIEFSITNNGASNETYSVLVSTSSSASASIGSPGNYAFAYSAGFVYDSLFDTSNFSAGFGQYSETEIQADNLLAVPNYTFTRNYLSGTSIDTTVNYPTSPSLSLSGSVSLTGYLYYITLAPGQTDDLYIISGEQHDDRTAIVPSPGAAIPFAFGLWGAIRKKRMTLDRQ
jgi:hypothetical protein